MDIKRIEKKLKKINKLVELYREEDEVSKVERDILLDYIKKLYEEVLFLDMSFEDEITPIKPKSKAKQKVETKEPIIRKVEERPVVVKEEKPITTEVVSSPAVIEEPKVEVKPKVEEVAVLTSKPEYDELFVDDEINDISARLARTKISDINKSMGINERIFTINELFGGSSDAYNGAIAYLNGLSNFQDARMYLEAEIIGKFSWMEDVKIKKAQNFIKLVRRLFVG